MRKRRSAVRISAPDSLGELTPTMFSFYVPAVQNWNADLSALLGGRRGVGPQLSNKGYCVAQLVSFDPNRISIFCPKLFGEITQ